MDPNDPRLLTVDSLLLQIEQTTKELRRRKVCATITLIVDPITGHLQKMEVNGKLPTQAAIMTALGQALGVVNTTLVLERIRQLSEAVSKPQDEESKGEKE